MIVERMSKNTMEKRQKQGQILSDDKMHVILVGPAAFSTIQNAGGTRISVNPPGACRAAHLILWMTSNWFADCLRYFRNLQG